jgi:hypothetical protein
MMPRTLPLYDPDAQPSSWNERMDPGEYAVHYSSSDQDGPGPICTVFESLVEAEAHAAAHVQLHPNQRCRIYDHNGFVGAPLGELRGPLYRGDTEISARFRRWVGSILFFGGIALTLIDWTHDFRLTWPAMIGTRMLIPGLVLLAIEAVLLLQARRKRADTHAHL